MIVSIIQIRNSTANPCLKLLFTPKIKATDNTTKSNKLEDTVFWYKADTHNDFKICLQHYWDVSKNILSNDDDVEDTYDPSKLKAKSKGPRIRGEKTKKY